MKREKRQTEGKGKWKRHKYIRGEGSCLFYFSVKYPEFSTEPNTKWKLKIICFMRCTRERTAGGAQTREKTDNYIISTKGKETNSILLKKG